MTGERIESITITIKIMSTSTSATKNNINRVRLGGAPLSVVSAAEAEEIIAEWVRLAPLRTVVTPNVDHVVELQKNEAFREAYEHAALSLADGAPIVWAARWLGLAGIEKVSGSDLVPALCARAAAEGWRVMFIGGAGEEDLAATLERIRERFRGIVIGGAFPPMGFERDAAIEERLLGAIDAFKPELILMGCGAPKSEIWLDRRRERIGRGVAIGIGSGIRFLAGQEKRAPRWMQRCGLEWSWRLAHDPLRLWRRYLVRDVQFLPLVWRWRNKKRSQ